jgi:hypothetical protein
MLRADVDAAQLSRQLAALRDPEMRARRAAEVFSQLPADEAMVLLAGLAHRAHIRVDPNSAALEGALRACRLYLSAETVAAMHASALEAGEDELLGLLSSAQASKAFDNEREAWVDRAMRSRTLGERKAMARGRDRDVLARLATDTDPTVVRALLQNPRVTEREVLIAASRRPARAAVLEEIFRSPRWAQNRRVRRALALNPYSPPALATTALALLTGPDLREVAADSNLSTEVRVHARRLLADRREANSSK